MRRIVRSILLSLLLTGCADDAADAAPVPTLAVESGISVTGAGPTQQWEGIVMTMRLVTATEGEVCTATFITARHLLTAAHCYEKAGVQKISVRAPTWSGKAWEVFERAVVHRASTDISVDIAVVDLGAEVPWATPARRFRLFAGRPTAADLHIYGYGARNEEQLDIDGTLRAAPSGAVVRIRDAGGGYLAGTANTARMCVGDSGGPVVREGTQPVVWGVFHAFSNSIARTLRDRDRVCPDVGSNLRFTSVSANLPFIERALGTPCTRIEVDGQAAVQCW